MDVINYRTEILKLFIAHKFFYLCNGINVSFSFNFKAERRILKEGFVFILWKRQ